MKASRTKNRFETGFQQLKTGLPRNLVLTSQLLIISCDLALTYPGGNRYDVMGQLDYFKFELIFKNLSKLLTLSFSLL